MVVKILVALIALQHVWTAVLEMFLWTKPRGMKFFGLTAEQAQSSAVLAKNQGLYNLFLVAALVLSLVLPSPQADAFQFYALSCVVVAGIYGGVTTGNRIILFAQGGPALVTIVIALLTR